MRRFPTFPHFLALLVFGMSPVFADAGPPLVRHDGAGAEIPGLLAILGNPRLGLAGEAGRRVQRIGAGDKWLFEILHQLQEMEYDHETGRVKSGAVIDADRPWCLSPDGGILFAGRDFYMDGDFGRGCFDFASGRRLWTLDAGRPVTDACFTPDGKSLVVLDSLLEPSGPVVPVLTWYDAASGARQRRIELPGVMEQSLPGILGVTAGAAFVSLPRTPVGEFKNTAEVYAIWNGKDEPVRLDLWDTASAVVAQIATGGPENRLVAIWDQNNARIYHEENGALKLIHEEDISNDADFSTDKSLRFQPGRPAILVSGHKRSRLVSLTARSDAPPLMATDFGSALGDFTADGKRYVMFNNGGGFVLDAANFKPVDPVEDREHPTLYRPIDGVVFSPSGNLLITNDERRLLLWSAKGVLLAELDTPNRETRDALLIHSPIFADGGKRVLAADGWDFLEWDMEALAKRVKRMPANAPRALGKTVYPVNRPISDRPEVMDIGILADGKSVFTATRTRFLIQPARGGGAPVELRVPVDVIMLQPRSINLEDPARLLVRSGSDTFLLDPEGKRDAKLLDSVSPGLSLKTNEFLRIDAFSGQAILQIRPLEEDGPFEDIFRLPPPLGTDAWEQMRVSPDGRWIATLHRKSGRASSLAILDRREKALIKDVPLEFTASSLDISPDGSRLAIGSTDCSVRLFDFEKLRADP